MSAIELRGPFFKTDAGRQVKAAISKAIIAVAREGKKDVQAQLYEGHGRDKGDFRKTIRTRKRGASSTIYSRDARISTWLQGTSKRNQTTRFKGYGIWDAAAKQTDGKAQDIADKIIHALTRDLN